MQVLKRPLAAAAFLFAIFLAPAVHAQTCSVPGQAGNASLTAQPNTFYPGSASAAAGAVSITLGAGAGPTAIAAGDLLLVIQMQGADINTTDASSYGSGTPGSTTATVAFGASGYAGGSTGTPSAGTYEWAVATNAVAIGGGTVNLSSPLVNGFLVRASSSTVTRQSFQVIRVPQYANVTLGSGLTVQAWDGNRGGVLVLEATGDINLNGNTIDGTGRGFRGAGSVVVAPNTTCTGNWNTTGCQGYVALISASLGGSKGEGIAGTPARIYDGDPAGAGTGTNTAGTTDGYPAGETSRGAPGNAGGGGNQHNAGGGGGGGGGAGGKGGNTWNSSTVGNFGLPYGGFGGSPSGNSASRWLLGGGGGAGDVGGNTWTSPDAAGGAGGALVILRASRVVGGGAVINVNGARGHNSRATDAGGGGGAGGTVVVAAGSGGLSGALTVNASGGAGGTYTLANSEQDGPGGGGGGGTYVSTANATGITFNAPGGAGGGSNTTSGCGGATNACGATTGNASAGNPGYAIVSPGVLVGYECLPDLAVTKATSTPLVTASTGATAAYTIAISNSGGAARFVNVQDLALPPGWTLAAAPTYTYGATPATRLPAGGETIAIATSSTWAVGAAPLTVPATGSNTLTWTSFAVPPITSGTPGQLTISFVATIPDTATAGTYHNGAGVFFLDPTRTAAVRTVAPLANVAANRSGTAYSANTTYLNSGGLSTVNVGGSHYSALEAGPAGENVRLIPDFSITKTAPATATPGTTFSYTITARNNGRPIGSQTYAVSQASDVSTANVPSVLGSNPVTVTDTLPANITLTTLSGTGWTCTVSGNTRVCTLGNANAYPVAAATNYAVISGTATFTSSCSVSTAAGTNSVIVSAGAGESVTSNNTASAVTTPSCNSANVSITKSDAVVSLVAGTQTSYTLTIANTGTGNADGSVVQDPVAPALSCTAVTCPSTTGGAVCPATLTVAALQGSGLTIPALPPSSSVTLLVTCGVTATGQ